MSSDASLVLAFVRFLVIVIRTMPPNATVAASETSTNETPTKDPAVAAAISETPTKDPTVIAQSPSALQSNSKQPSPLAALFSNVTVNMSKGDDNKEAIKETLSSSPSRAHTDSCAKLVFSPSTARKLEPSNQAGGFSFWGMFKAGEHGTDDNDQKANKGKDQGSIATHSDDQRASAMANDAA